MCVCVCACACVGASLADARSCRGDFRGIIMELTLLVPRGPDRQGEWREHHREDILPGHSPDPEQVRAPSPPQLP